MKIADLVSEDIYRIDKGVAIHVVAGFKKGPVIIDRLPSENFSFHEGGFCAGEEVLMFRRMLTNEFVYILSSDCEGVEADTTLYKRTSSPVIE